MTGIELAALTYVSPHAPFPDGGGAEVSLRPVPPVMSGSDTRSHIRLRVTTALGSIAEVRVDAHELRAAADAACRLAEANIR